MKDPCKGVLELSTPRPMVFKAEYVRNEFKLIPGIAYEKGAHVVF